MQRLLTLISGLIAVIGVIPYIRDTLKGKTKPNVVTWSTWTLLNIINVAATLSEGAWQTAAVSVAGGLGTGAIAVLGFKQGVRRYTRFDIACQVVVLVGIALWLLTKQPTFAVIMILVVSLASGLPTLRHAWQAPHEETPHPFLMGAVGSLLLLASLNTYSFVAVALPGYILLFDLLLVITILLRRKKKGEVV